MNAPVNLDLGRAWWVAEYFGQPPVAWDDIPAAEKERVLQRVYDVYERRVPPAELTPGDVAVIAGPHRAASPFDVPLWVIEKFFPGATKPVEDESPFESHNYGATRKPAETWCFRLGEWYDSNGPRASSSEWYQNTRLLGNANIGDMGQSNMQVASQLASDQLVLLTHWWVRALPEDEEWETRLPRFLDAVRCTLVVNDRPRAHAVGLDMWRRPQPILVDVPVRSTVSIDFGIYNRWPLGNCPMRPVAVHLAGWQGSRLRLGVQ